MNYTDRPGWIPRAALHDLALEAVQVARGNQTREQALEDLRWRLCTIIPDRATLEAGLDAMLEPARRYVADEDRREARMDELAIELADREAGDVAAGRRDEDDARAWLEAVADGLYGDALQDAFSLSLRIARERIARVACGEWRR